MMGSFLTIQLERPLCNAPDPLVGRCLARTQAQLDLIPERLGLEPLRSFLSMSEGEARELRENLPEWNSWFETRWFDAAAGLATVRGLLDHLRAHPDEAAGLIYHEDVLKDLEAAANLLTAARQEEVRFYFGIGL
jgi:hypothetical protein